ncbi:MAG: type II toxin-antitoxin system VapC family toxin [Spirochaetales bacterium]|nr:type II toxin-antitoxin system VapC family toxin [Spirochaetales bacterium]
MASYGERIIKVVIDTMVFIYALWGVIPYRDEALAVLEKTKEIIVPDSVRAEIVNVIWQWIQWAQLPTEKGLFALQHVQGLFTEVVPCHDLWFMALDLSLKNDHPAYDTLFVALADQRKTKLVTYDSKLIEKFPRQVCCIKDYLGK